MKRFDWVFASIAAYFSVLIILGLLGVDYGLVYHVFLVMMLLFAWVVKYFRLYNKGAVYAGLVILGALHALGSIVYVNGFTLYYTWLFNGFRWDNLVHIFGSIVATLIAYGLMHPHVKSVKNKIILSLIIIFVGLGIGAGIEILELMTLIFFKTTEVGNYLNNAWDLVFDALGACIACFIILAGKRAKH